MSNNRQESLQKLVNVLNEAAKQRQYYARLVAQNFNIAFPNDIFELILKKIRPNMKITFFDDPMDLYYTFKMKEVTSYKSATVFRNFYEVTVIDTDLVMHTDGNVDLGSFVKEYDQVIENTCAKFSIGIPHVFYKTTTTIYEKCIAKKDGDIVHLDNEITSTEKRLYVYYPDPTKFAAYYKRLAELEKEEIQNKKLKFLEELKKLYKYKVSFQETLLKECTDLPFDVIEDMTKAIVNYKDAVGIVIVTDPVNLEKEFYNVVSEQVVTTKEVNPPLIKRNMEKETKLITNIKATPGYNILLNNDRRVVQKPIFDPSKVMVFKQNIKLKDEIYGPEDYDLQNLSSTSYTELKVVFAYVPDDELVKKYKKLKLDEKRKKIRKGK